MPRAGSHRLLRSVVFGLGLALALVGLAACSPNQDGSGTAAAPTVTPQTHKCGMVHLVLNGRIEDQTGARQAESCFYQAYQHCQPATLDFIMMGVDSGISRTFTITKNGNACVVTDIVQSYVLPTHAHNSATYTCTGGVIQTQTGLLFRSCGKDGDVAVAPLTNQ